MKTTVAVDSAIFFFCFESDRDDIRPGDVQRLLRHLSGTPNIAIYVPITVIGETVVEYLTEDASKHEINELHELIDFWGALHLNFLYPTDLVADACYKLVEMYRRGSQKDYRLSDTDLVHLGYALARIVSWSLLALTIGAKQTIDLKVKLYSASSDVLNRVKVVAQYENRTILAEASAPQEAIIVPQVYNVSSNYTSGIWRPPTCFDLGLNLTECDKAIEKYMNGEDSTTGGCCPQVIDIYPESYR